MVRYAKEEDVKILNSLSYWIKFTKMLILPTPKGGFCVCQLKTVRFESIVH